MPFPVLHSDVTCDEWSFYLLPLDEDIISMELPEFFRDYFLVSRDGLLGAACGMAALLSLVCGPRIGGLFSGS